VVRESHHNNVNVFPSQKQLIFTALVIRQKQKHYC